MCPCCGLFYCSHAPCYWFYYVGHVMSHYMINMTLSYFHLSDFFCKNILKLAWNVSGMRDDDEEENDGTLKPHTLGSSLFNDLDSNLTKRPPRIKPAHTSQEMADAVAGIRKLQQSLQQHPHATAATVTSATGSENLDSIIQSLVYCTIHPRYNQSIVCCITCKMQSVFCVVLAFHFLYIVT